MKISLGLHSDKRKPADLMISAVFQGDKQPSKLLQKIDPAAYELSKRAIQTKRFEGKEGESLPVFGTDQFKGAKDFLLAGLGKKEAYQPEKLRKTVGNLLCRAKSQKAKSVRFLIDDFSAGKVSSAQAARIVPEIFLLADYKFDRYLQKKKDEPARDVDNIELVYGDRKEEKILEAALKRSEAVARAVNFTRDLINEPANVMSPEAFAREASAAARKAGLGVKVLGLSEIKRLKMSGMIAVSQGSKQEPRFLVLEYGANHKGKGTVCLVGKGVCFDSGGISIKPSKDMEKMKYDMSGAAAVAGTMLAVSHLKPSFHVVGVAPLVENMPSGSASRPGDIITYKNGKSAEIINTDAEGRLILADALIYACEHYKPKALIDLATLTGACVVALADKCAGIMGNDQKLIDRLIDTGERVGERLWQLPLWEDYFEIIKGHHSDILNAGSGYGGTITAAKFLEQFVDCKSWAHLDIAGTAWVDSAKPYNFRGATGFGVRLLCEFLEGWK